MAFFRSLRLNLYGFILALAICQTALTASLSGDSVWSSGPGFSFLWYTELAKASHLVAYYACAAAVISLCTWIWVSVLLAYNNRRKSDHPLALAFPHFISFAILSVFWLVLGILLLTETRFSCGNEPNLGQGRAEAWCGLTIATGTIGLVLWLLTTLTALIIYITSRKSSLGLRSKIVSQDGEEDPGPLKGPMENPTAIRTALYALIIILGVPGSGIALFHALFTRNMAKTERTFASLACAFSLVSWIWASVLLDYNRRPSTRRTLTRASTHFYSLAVLAVLELAIALMVLSLRTQGCIRDFCWVRGVNGGLSIGLCATLIASAVYVYLRTVKGGGRLSESNVAQFDGGIEGYSNGNYINLTHTQQ